MTNNEASRLPKVDMRSEDRYEVRRVRAKKRKEDNATRDGRDLWGNVLGKDERTLDWSGTVLAQGSQRKAEGERCDPVRLFLLYVLPRFKLYSC